MTATSLSIYQLLLPSVSHSLQPVSKCF